MLNHELNKYVINNKVINKFDKIHLDYYEKFISNDLNNKYAYNYNKYNLITPDFKNIKDSQYYTEKNINGYRKIFFNNKKLNFMSEYDSYYPENFYYYWEILNKFKIIDENMTKFMFIDDGKKTIYNNNSLGHIEATIKYCEDNHKFEKNIYIRMPLNKIKIEELDKKFISTYKNHKIFEFTESSLDEIAIKKMYKYFQNDKYDFIISNSIIFSQNILSLLLCHYNSNIIMFINDFLDEKNDSLISNISELFEYVYIYQPEIQNSFDKSCFLILINYKNSNNDLLSDILNSKKTPNEKFTLKLKDIRKVYKEKYLEKLLEMYNNIKIKNIKFPLENEYDFNDQDSIELCKKWIKDNKLILKSFYDIRKKDNENKYESYIFNKYNLNLNFKKDDYCIYDSKLYEIKRELNKYKRIIETKEQNVNDDLENDIIDWNKLIELTNLYKNLKKKIAWKFNAEMVNNAWLKFYELLSHENLILKDNDRIKIFYICDNIESFIMSTNHFINTNTKIKNYQWYVYNHNNEKSYLKSLYPTKWIYCNEDKGNFVNNFLDNYKLINLDLIIYHKNNKSDDNEIYNWIYIILHLLPKNKSFVIKLYSPLCDWLSITLLYLLVNVFNQVKIIKQATSCAISDEIYCVCKEYHGYDNLSEDIKKIIESMLTKEKIINNKIVPENLIQEKFMEEIILMNKKYSEIKIDSIKKILYLRNSYYYDYDLQKEITELREEFENYWINENKINIIEEDKKIIKY